MKPDKLIFRNYEKFLRENQDLTSANNAVNMITNPDKFNKYANALLEGFSDDIKSLVRPILDRQRDFVIEESSANIGVNDVAIGYIISYFPILCDIYTSDILYQAIVHHPINKPLITIPRVNIQAKVKNSDGTENTYPIPRATRFIRQKAETFQILPNKINRLFEMSASYPTGHINSTLSRVNRRFFVVNSATVKATGGGLPDDIYDIVLNIRPDARGQIHKEFVFEDHDFLISGNLVGRIEWDNGLVQYNCTYKGNPSGRKYEIEYLESDVVFSAKTGEIGRVKVSMHMSGWDIDADIAEDFEVELITEVIQEYKDIYNIDMIKVMSEVIKTQFLLNRDWTISFILKMAEREMKQYGTYQKLNFQPFRDTLGTLSPGFLSSIYQAIVPRIAINNRIININYRANPQYLLTGVRTAAVLELLQEWAITTPDMRHATAGFDTAHGIATIEHSFRTQKILTSPALDNDKIYTIYKPEAVEDLFSSVIINFIYKPLYIVEEITNSQKRTFVRSRSALELVSPEAIGCIECTGFIDILMETEEMKEFL